MEDLKFDKESLALITKGLNSAISELKDVGSVTGSLQGSGFEEMSMTGMEAGRHGLADDFEDFCERWEWGVRALVQDANALAQRLGLAAGMVHEEDQYGAGTLKVGVNSLVGNPHATEEEVAQQSWGDIFTPDCLNPDCSAESFDRPGEEMAQTWKDTGRALTEAACGGLQSDLAMDAAGISRRAAESRPVDDTLRPVAGGTRPAATAAGSGG